MNAFNQSLLGPKEPRVERDRERLAAVAGLPCCICWEWEMQQNSRTEVHHCKSGRYGRNRAPDCMTIPLCHSHHNKLRPYPGDEGKIGFHNGQETWEGLYGLDTDWISWTEERIGQ